VKAGPVVVFFHIPTIKPIVPGILLVSYPNACLANHVVFNHVRKMTAENENAQGVLLL
jgi:hypothetical protein